MTRETCWRLSSPQSHLTHCCPDNNPCSAGTLSTTQILRILTASPCKWLYSVQHTFYALLQMVMVQWKIISGPVGKWNPGNYLFTWLAWLPALKNSNVCWQMLNICTHFAFWRGMMPWKLRSDSVLTAPCLHQQHYFTSWSAAWGFKHAAAHLDGFSSHTCCTLGTLSN